MLNPVLTLRRILLLFLFFIAAPFCFSQVVINEICTSNNSVVQDEEGDYPDWIELYNSGVFPVNLFDYSLSDDAGQLRKWILPNYVLAPSAHVLIFASDKDRKNRVHHWETVIKDDDVWKYVAPTSEPEYNWKEPSFNDAAWASGKGGFGYADGDDSTIVPSPRNSVFIRKTFTVTDKTKIAQAMLHIDYDDGYVAYLNGYAIGRRNMPDGVPPYNTDATAGREAVMYTGGLPEAKMVNTDTLLMALVNGTNVLCIQVHNNNLYSSDLTARAFLSFGIADASVLYNPTPAWFTMPPIMPMHTNFKLSAGDPVYLQNNLSTTVDFKTTINTRTDHSYGRKPDGAAGWEIFTAPTPGASNNSAASVTSYCNQPLFFSDNAGFYNSSRSISITGSSEIRYTLDGSEPTAASPLYTAPVTISATKVLRAGCFTGGTIPYQIHTNTYIINSPTSLPVFSISTKPDLLFDPITGIYMLGPDADSVNLPHFGANYWEDIDIPIHVEFFETNKTQIFEQGADLRIYGNWSRANDQKSFALKASKQYGKDKFEHRFFPDKYTDKFTQIVLRNSGGDCNVMHYRDGFIQKSVSKKTSIDIQDYRPAVIYLNGEYWGILNIRKKINEEYVSDKSGVDKDSVDLAETWGQALAGSNNIYVMQWLSQNLDMSVAANFNVVADSFDLDNMVDYFATEIFISNWDWPQNNIKFWRPQQGARKWRYILWDTDISYGLFNLQPASFNQLGRIRNAPPVGMQNSIGPHADIFNALLDNVAFRNKFVNRYADLMNTLFRTSTLDKLLYDMRDSIATEITKHQTKWYPWTIWPDEIQKTKTFYTDRLAYARNEVRTEFGLTKQVNITLAASPAGAGYIKINSIVPETYPWTGVYFDGVPVQITAYPNPGYTFSHWLSSGLITSPNSNKSITINVTNVNETFTAYFTGASASLQLTVSEINYHSLVSADAGDWLELYNYGSAAVDMSGWSIRDLYHTYNFPDNTKLASGGRLVLVSDPAKFSAQFPLVTNMLGPLGFSLSNDGDYIGLYDVKDDPYISFVYNDVLPWPLLADGVGYTLESTGNTDNPSLSSSWFAGCMSGSPGSPYNTSCILTSVENQKAEGVVNIYPNPAKNFINIDVHNAPAFTEWKLINSQGVELSGKEIVNGTSSCKIELNGLPSGLYSVVFYGENTIVMKKVIIR